MGLLDHLKGAAEKVAEGAQQAPGVVGSGAKSLFVNPVTKTAVSPLVKGWNASVGEWGDRDYVDYGGDTSSAAEQRDSVLQGIAEQALAGDPSSNYSNSPEALAMIERARAFGLAPEALPMQGLLESASSRGFDGSATAEFHRSAGMGPIGGASLIEQWWDYRSEMNKAKESEDAVGQAYLDVLDNDVTTLLDEQKDNGNIQNWNGIAQMAIQMIENSKGVEDEEAAENYAFAMGILNEYQEELQVHVELEAPGWWEENFEFHEGPSKFNRVAVGLGTPVLETLDKSSQFALRGVQATARGDVLDPDFWTKGGKGAGYTYGGEDERLSFIEALVGEEGEAKVEEALGDWAPILNLAGEIATDPLTYLTLGAGRATKIAEGAVTRQAAKAAVLEGGDEVVKHSQAILAQIRKGGLSSLQELDRIQFERWMLADAMDVAKAQGSGLSGAARSKFDKVIRKGGDRMVKLDEKATKIAQKNIDDVARGGQAGVAMGGNTLLAYQDIPGIRRLMDSFEIGTKSKLVDTGRTQTVGRFENTTSFDDVTSTRWRATAGETTGLIDETLDPRIGFLRAKAAGTEFAEEADAFTRKADELADRLRKGEGDPQTEIKWVEDTITERIERNDVRWIEDTLPVLDEMTYSYIKNHNPGLMRQIAEKAPFAAVRRRLVPRAGMINRIGRRQSDAFIAEIRKAQGVAHQSHRDIINRLQGRLGRDAAKEFGGDNAALSEFLNRAMSSADQMVSARMRFGVDTSTGKLLNALEDARTQVWETLSDEHKALFGNRDSYIPRTLSENGRKLLENMDKSTLAALMDSAPEFGKYANKIRNEANFGTARIGSMANDPYTSARNFARGLQDLTKVNKEVAEWLKEAGIDLPDLFEEDLLVAWGTRSNAAFRARIVGDIAHGMKGLTDDQGYKLFANIGEYNSLDSAQKINLTTEPTDIFGEAMYVHKDLVQEMEDFTQVLLDPNRMDSFGKQLNAVNGLWARYATLSPGFHSRNIVGNVFNAFLSGVTNPIRYADAAALQNTHRKAQRLMGKEGLSFEQAVAKSKGLYDEMVSGAAKAGQDINEFILTQIPDAQVLKHLENHRIMSGLVGDIFSETNVEKTTLGNVINPKVRTKANLTEISRNVGTWAEHNARTAVFLDQLAKGASPEMAANHVRKYLFDYEDLTRWETGVRRNVSRFYTWMRKNTALQIEALAKSPGRTINAQRIVEEATAQVFGDEDRSSMLPPQWAQAAGMKVRDGGNAIGIETPFYSAMNTVEDIMAVPTAVAIEAGLPVPETVEEAIGWHGVQDAFQSALGLFSGLPKSVADLMFSQATGYDPFTGGALKFDDTPGWLVAASTINPALNRVIRLAEDAGWDGLLTSAGYDEDGRTVENARESTGLNLWHWLGGVQVYEAERIEGSAASTLKFDMQQMISDSKETMPWKSLDDLRQESRIETVNRFMYIMAYGGDYGEDPEKFMEQLQGIVPKEVLELFGFNADKRRYSSQIRPLDEQVANERALVEAVDALGQLMGRELTQDEKLQVMLMSSGVPYDSELEEQFSIEPDKDYSDGGVFAPEDAPQDRDPEQMLAGMAAAIGLTIDEIQQLRPMRTEVERLQEQARMSGAMPGQVDAMVSNYIIENMSRTKLGTWFGTDVLPTHGWMGYDERDAAYDQDRAWEAAAEFEFLYLSLTGKRPNAELINQAVIQVIMGKGDQEDLVDNGLLSKTRPSIPNRKNVQTDAEQLEDIGTQYESILGGIENGPWLGEKPEADPRNDQEWGGVGLPIAGS